MNLIFDSNAGHSRPSERSDFDAAAVESVHASYRSEVARLKMQLVLYRNMLLEHGIEPPDSDGDDLLELVRDCNTVVTSASAVLQHLGTGKELMFGW